MGRTKRKRARKEDSFSVVCLDGDPSVVALKQWMKANGWKNDNVLRLALFEQTGRGLTSRKKTPAMGTLIEVPYNLMITYSTLQDSFLSDALLPMTNAKLKMQDLLSIFLVFERHKGSRSKWQAYINSLPKAMPHLPWMCSHEEMERIPGDLQASVQDSFRTFESSWERSIQSINQRWKCECCGIPGHCVLTRNSFCWAYVMVNTRAVYVDPGIVRGLSFDPANSLGCTLSDDPSMALCPYLDMFNHSNRAATRAELDRVSGKWVFRLVALTPSEKHEEIFISYGAHDNVKLLCEYGFFIPDDELDAIGFDFDEILKCSRLSITARQYKFIRERQLDQKLNVSVSGLSFNLKAALFVVLNADVVNWCACIFNENYTEAALMQMRKVVLRLMQIRTAQWSSELNILRKDCHNVSDPFKNVLGYLEHMLTFTGRMYDRISFELV